MASSHEFRTELQQLLDILIHSLYSEREIFLRELISNATDAIDKARFASLSDSSIANDGEWRIRITPNQRESELLIEDNGIGMDESEAVENLGTIARSGTKEFLKTLQAADESERPSLIGQFGVGFYSAFMVAEEVVVDSLKQGAKAVRWSSNGDGRFEISDGERSERGTTIRLKLKEDAAEFLEPSRIREVVKRWSDFVEHAIELVEDPHKDEDSEGGSEVINSRKALWLKSPSEVSEEEYEGFYRQISSDHNPPARTIHFAAEGTLEYRALLFVPTERPFDLFATEREFGPQLYVQRVFILEHCAELLPPWLRFVRGLVDSNDLPLNVSREILQDNPLLPKIRRGLQNKVLRVLEEMLEQEREEYAKFFTQFGTMLKEGVHADFEARERLSKLLLFSTSKDPEGPLRTLAEVVADQKEGSDTLWYLLGEDPTSLAKSPALEALLAEGEEVLLLSDPIDEFVVHSVGEIDGRKLKPANGRDESEEDDVSAGTKERFAALIGAADAWLEDIADIRLSSRLRNSAACLVDSGGGPAAPLRRMFEQMGRGSELPPIQKSLELNPEHPVVRDLLERYENRSDDPSLPDRARLLADQAALAAGEELPDPQATALRLSRLLAGDLDGQKEASSEGH